MSRAFERETESRGDSPDHLLSECASRLEAFVGERSGDGI